MTGQQLEEQRTERVNVPASVGDRVQTGLFGRHVEQRAECRILLVRKSRLAEVAQSWFKIGIEQDVGRFEIAVQDASPVGVYECLANSPNNPHGFFRFRRAFVDRSVSSEPRSRYSIT